MPEITRRRTWPDAQRPDDDWSIYYGDIGVGRLMRHQGTAREMWRWSVGFYPGRHPAYNKAGTTDTFEQAREAWAKAWEAYLPDCTEEQFEEYRDWHRYRYGGLPR